MWWLVSVLFNWWKMPTFVVALLEYDRFCIHSFDSTTTYNQYAIHHMYIHYMIFWGIMKLRWEKTENVRISINTYIDICIILLCCIHFTIYMYFFILYFNWMLKAQSQNMFTHFPQPGHPGFLGLSLHRKLWL